MNQQATAIDQEGLDVLFPNKDVTLAGGQTVTVKPLMFAQLPQGARHIDGVIRAALRSGMVTEQGELNLSSMAGMYAEAGEHINELVLLTVHHGDERVDRDWLDTVSVEDGLVLAGAVVQVNWRASIIKKMEALSGEMETLGQTILNRLGSSGSASSSD